MLRRAPKVAELHHVVRLCRLLRAVANMLSHLFSRLSEFGIFVAQVPMAATACLGTWAVSRCYMELKEAVAARIRGPKA